MLRVPFLSADRDRKLDLGSGDSKDKMMVGALVIVIVAAIAVLIWSISTKRPSGREGEDTIAQCVDPDCGYREEMTNEQWGERVVEFEQAHPQLIRGMQPLRLECPKCHNPKYTFVKGMTCPACGEMFVSPNQLARARRATGFPATPHRGPILCPKCGVDVEEYWATHRGKNRK